MWSWVMALYHLTISRLKGPLYLFRFFPLPFLSSFFLVSFLSTLPSTIFLFVPIFFFLFFPWLSNEATSSYLSYSQFNLFPSFTSRFLQTQGTAGASCRLRAVRTWHAGQHATHAGPPRTCVPELISNTRKSVFRC